MVMGFFVVPGICSNRQVQNYVFILREASPVGPRCLNGYYQRFCEKKLFMILDDAIWITWLGKK
jgi:hypothetical protein